MNGKISRATEVVNASQAPKVSVGGREIIVGSWSEFLERVAGENGVDNVPVRLDSFSYEQLISTFADSKLFYSLDTPWATTTTTITTVWWLVVHSHKSVILFDWGQAAP